jgi:hypothetical protein
LLALDELQPVGHRRRPRWGDQQAHGQKHDGQAGAGRCPALLRATNAALSKYLAYLMLLFHLNVLFLLVYGPQFDLMLDLMLFQFIVLKKSFMFFLLMYLFSFSFKLY